MVNDAKGNRKDKNEFIIKCIYTLFYLELSSYKIIYVNSDEAAKVSHHLSLLKEEYNKLHARHTELLRQVGSASISGQNGSTFLQRLLKFVGSLYQSDYLR